MAKGLNRLASLFGGNGDKVTLDESLLKEAGFDTATIGQLKSALSKREGTQAFVQGLRKNTTDREALYKEYREISRDPVIGQAIEMMADDATQFDVERDRTVWVEAKRNKAKAEKINAALRVEIEPFIDSIAAAILRYGEFAFRVGDVTEEVKKVEGIGIFPVKDLASLHHIIFKDMVHGFIMTNSLTAAQSDQALQLIPRDKIIHFVNYSLENSQELKLKVKRGKTDVVENVFHLQGESLLTEPAREAYRILSAMEDALIAARMAKSQFLRVVSVETSKLDNAKAANVVNYVDGLVNSNEQISKSSGDYQVSRSQPTPTTIVVPVKDTKGRISVEEFGTNFDIKDIVDIEYFRNKLFAAIKIPKAYLGVEDSLPGLGGGGSSLMKMDIKYARAVKKVQRVILGGVKEYVDAYIKQNKMGEFDYKVKILKVFSPEDEERTAELEQRIALPQQLFDMIYSPETGTLDRERLEIMQAFYADVVPMENFSNFLQELIDKAPVEPEVPEEDEVGVEEVEEVEGEFPEGI